MERIRIFCKRCLYNLDGLAENRCPECGCAFDPANRRTFYRSSRRRINWLGWITIGVSFHPLLLYATLLALWVSARLALGRWPVAWADDPEYIDDGGVRFFLLLVGLVVDGTWLALCVAPIGLAASLVWAIVGRQRWRAFIRLAIATLLLWVGGISLLRFEPLDLVGWYIDEVLPPSTRGR